MSNLDWFARFGGGAWAGGNLDVGGFPRVVSKKNKRHNHSIALRNRHTGKAHEHRRERARRGYGA